MQDWNEERLAIDGLSDEEEVDQQPIEVPMLEQWRAHETFAIFLKDKFGPEELTYLLSSSQMDPKQLLETLRSAHDLLDTHIRDQVVEHLNGLWSHSLRLQTLKGDFDEIRSTSNGLVLRYKAAVHSITQKKSLMQESCDRIRSVNEDILFVKSCLRFMQLVRRLAKNVGDDPVQLGKKASALYNIHKITDTIPKLCKLSIFSNEKQCIEETESNLRKATLKLFSDAFHDQDQSLLSSTLQIYHNLHELSLSLEHFLIEFIQSNAQQMENAFELSSLGNIRSKTSRETETQHKSWRSALWRSVDTLMETLFTSFSRIFTLELVLSKKYDFSSDMSYLDIFRQKKSSIYSTPSTISLVEYFWSKMFIASLKNVTETVFSRSSFIRKTLIAEFPRFYQVLDEFMQRLIQNGLAPSKSARSDISGCVSSFSSLYLSKCITTMNEPVNLMFDAVLDSQKLMSLDSTLRLPIPTKSDMKMFFHSIVSVMEAVRKTPELHEHVIKGVVSSIQLFSIKTDELIDAIRVIESRNKARGQSSITLDPHSESTHDRLALVFDMISVLDAMLGSFLQSENSALAGFKSSLIDLLDQSRTGLRERCEGILKPLLDPSLSQLCKVLDAILNSKSTKVSPDGSPFIENVKEEFKFINRKIFVHFPLSNPIVLEYMLQFCLSFLRAIVDRASLLGNTSEQVHVVVAADMAIMEDLVKRFLRLSSRRHDIFKEIEEFRWILFASNEEIMIKYARGIEEGIRPIVVVHVLFSRRGILPMPHAKLGWSLPKYLYWLQENWRRDSFDMIRQKVIEPLLHSEKGTDSEKVLSFLNGLTKSPVK